MLAVALSLGAGAQVQPSTVPITNTATPSGTYYVYFLNERDYIWEGMEHCEASKILPKSGSFMLSGPTLNGSFSYHQLRIRVSFVDGKIDAIQAAR
jgi:hypothetical protein